MRKFLIVILIFMVGVIQAKSMEIYRSSDKQIISLDELASETNNFEVIFFGEYHDNSILHEIEFELLRRLHKLDEKIAVSMEMFEVDVQAVVDSFSNFQINEKDFMEKSRAWPNYSTDYRNIVEISRMLKLPLIAANIPRPLASQLARGTSPDEISEPDKRYLPTEFNLNSRAYRTKFYEVMNSNGMMGHGAMDDTMLSNMFSAQCLKDATMANSIANFRKQNPDLKIIHYNGEFHSSYNLGTVEQLRMRIPEIATVVISPVYRSDFNEESFAKGDYLIVLVDPEPDTEK